MGPLPLTSCSLTNAQYLSIYTFMHFFASIPHFISKKLSFCLVVLCKRYTFATTNNKTTNIMTRFALNNLYWWRRLQLSVVG